MALLLTASSALSLEAQTDCPERSLGMPPITEVAGREIALPVSLHGQGNENALSFTLGFDPARLSYRGETVGADALGTSLLINTNQVATGRVGYALAKPSRQRFSAGSNELVRVRFRLSGTPADTAVVFTNTPVAIEVVDDAAGVLCVSASNSAVTITPLFLPGIATQPEGRTVQPILGVATNVTLSVVATGSPPLTYQWRFEGTDIPWATNSSMTLTNANESHSGGYDVTVSNSGGVVTSELAEVTVLPPLVPPTIVSQPQSWVASAGETVLFAVTASGTPPLTYQWRFYGNPLAGETNRALMLTNVTPARSGDYSVVVSNRAGTVTSANASLTVSATPRTLRLIEASVATAAEVEVPVQFTALGDENALGFSVAYDPLRLSFVRATVGSGAPGASLMVNSNDTASGRVGLMLVRAARDRFGAGTAEALRLRFRAGDISGPAPVDFANQPVAVEVVDVWGTPRPVTTSNGVVNVLSTPPSIVTQPQSRTNAIFTTAQFSVEAAGSAPLRYQWQLNGANLAGQTNALLTLPGVRPPQTGEYRVIVSNPVAAVTSAVATLTVPRVVRVASTNKPTGNLVDVPLHLLAHGDENAVGFTLRFDPVRLDFREIVSNSAPAGATVNVNTNTAVAGSLGFVVAQPSASAFAWGTQQLAVVRFRVGGTAGDAAVTFGDVPVLREVVSKRAEPLLVDFQGGVVSARLVAPVVTQQPVDRDVLQGTAVTFEVAAEGSLPLSFQWQRNGVNLPGQTNATLTLANALLNDSGSYSARISNAAGTANTAAAILNVRPPPADLLITRLEAPAGVVAGQPVTLWWTVANNGTQTAAAPRRDRVFVADDAQGRNARALGDFTFFDSLSTNQWLSHTGEVMVPTDLAGPRFFGVMVDSAYQVPESDELNNWLWATNATTVGVADLSLGRLTAPATARFGETIAVEWAVTNIGTAAVQATWNDRLYLSPSSNSIAGATVLDTAAGTSPLAPDEGYLRSPSVTLPLDAQMSAGNYFIVVVADVNNGQPEASEANNTAFAPIALTMPPRPDLVAAEVRTVALALPGETVPVTWAVTNLGLAALSNASWSETVSISNVLAGTQALARFDFTNSVAVEAGLVRTQVVVLPATLAAGDNWLVVTLDSRSEVWEENETNNTAVAATPLSVPAILSLQLAGTQVAEGASLRATLTRNGSRAQALAITLANGDPTELALPGNVTIPAGAALIAFDVPARRDGLVDGPQTVVIQASAPGYQDAVVSVTVLDVDVPKLSLAFATNAVEEGKTVGATVIREVAGDQPLTANLSSSSPARLVLPEFVVIPPGANAQAFAVLAVDDLLVMPSQACAITVSAAGHASESAVLTVLDNDWPGITLELEAASASEADGPMAVRATVTRTNLSPRPLVVILFSGDTNLAVLPPAVRIPAYEPAKSFHVGTVNDALLNGPRPVTLYAYVADSVTGAPLGDPVSAVLTVTDDDGPTLSVELASPLLREGGSTAAVVRRNFVTNSPVAVTLASSDTTEATTPVTVTVPADANAASFVIDAQLDGVTDGTKVVSITATADGYTAGSALLRVSDVNLPDLAVTEVSGPATAFTSQLVNLSFRVSNQGIAAMTNPIKQRVFLSPDPFPGDDFLVGDFAFNEAQEPLQPGLWFEQSVGALLPLTPGDYWVVVTVDIDEAATELDEDNNTRVSLQPIRVGADYTATVETDVTIALAGVDVPLRGRVNMASGGSPEGRPVNVHLVTRGFRRVLPALARKDGSFDVVFHPLPSEAGRYTVGAAHPGMTEAPVQDEFTLLGAKLEPESLSLKVTESSSVSGQASIENLSDVPLTGLRAVVEDAPASLAVTVTLSAATLPGNGAVSLDYHVAAVALGASPVGLTVRVTSAEGVEVVLPATFVTEPLRPRLVAYPGALEGGMRRGGQALVEFDLVNEGGAPSGPATVSLPSTAWMRLASVNPMPSLDPGGSNKVMLLLTPAADLALNQYNGQIALNAPGASLGVPFTFRAVSDAKGDLKVIAVDEYTYYAEGAPRVTNALVTIQDALSGTTLVSGRTDANGEYFVRQLPEAYYVVEVSAEKHSPYRSTIFLPADTVAKEVTALLPRQTVRYIWTVEEVPFEERVNVVVQTVFETEVPTPVIVVEPTYIDLSPLRAPGQEMYVNIKVANKGLIAAHHGKLTFDEHPLYRVEPAIRDVGTLRARSEVVIPTRFRRLDGAALTSTAKVQLQFSGPFCSLNGSYDTDWLCGFDNVASHTGITTSGLDGCSQRPSPQNTSSSSPEAQANEVASVSQSEVQTTRDCRCDNAQPHVSFEEPIPKMTLVNVAVDFRATCTDGTLEWKATGAQGGGPPFVFPQAGTYTVTAICKCNEKSSEQSVQIKVVSVEFVTPAGDPVSQPASQSELDGQNEFVFSDTEPATLAMKLKARLSPTVSEIPDELREKIRFRVEAIGESTLEWSSDAPDGRPRLLNGNLVATARFHGLPANNSAFGKKTARIVVAGQTVAETPYEVFYKKHAADHPGNQPSAPNWFFYWRQLVGENLHLVFDPIPEINPYTGTISLGDTPGMTKWSYTAPPDKANIRVFPAAAERADPYNAGAEYSGIDLFANVVLHESRHIDQIARADTILAENVGAAVGTCFQYGWSWAQVPHNHWTPGPDGKWGVKGVDDDWNDVIDDAKANPHDFSSPLFEPGWDGSDDVSLSREIDGQARFRDWPRAWPEPQGYTSLAAIEADAVIFAAPLTAEDKYKGVDWGAPGKNFGSPRYDD